MTTLTHSLLGLVLLCCAAGKAYPAPGKKPPRVVVPGFRIAITYSTRASVELKRRGETVVILAYPFGRPGKGAPRNLVSNDGEISLGNDLHAEIQPGQIANIPTLTLDQNNLKYLTPAGVQVLLNVISGRKSSPDNLLNCDIYEGPLRKVQSQTIPIHCKIIGE